MLLRNLHVSVAASKLRLGVFQGREHVIVPVTALVEGVIWPVNAETPEYVPASFLAKAPAGWNGRPVVLGHPTENGAQVSANTPKRVETLSWGYVFNTTSGDALRMEAWLDPEKAKSVPGAARALDRLRAGQTVEVSVSGWVTLLDNAGEFNGKKYRYVWFDVIPDHLAILDEVSIGACSVEMGCGALRHAETHRHLVTACITTPTNACDCTQKGNTHVKNPVRKTYQGWVEYFSALDDATVLSPTHADLTNQIRAARGLTALADDSRQAVTQEAAPVVTHDQLTSMIRAARVGGAR